MHLIFSQACTVHVLLSAPCLPSTALTFPPDITCKSCTSCLLSVPRQRSPSHQISHASPACLAPVWLRTSVPHARAERSQHSHTSAAHPGQAPSLGTGWPSYRGGTPQNRPAHDNSIKHASGTGLSTYCTLCAQNAAI